jgi:hypothetical protein
MCAGCNSGTQSAYNQGAPGQARGAVTQSQSVNEEDLNGAQNVKNELTKSDYKGNPSDGGNGALS